MGIHAVGCGGITAIVWVAREGAQPHVWRARTGIFHPNRPPVRRGHVSMGVVNVLSCATCEHGACVRVSARAVHAGSRMTQLWMCRSMPCLGRAPCEGLLHAHHQHDV